MMNGTDAVAVGTKVVVKEAGSLHRAVAEFAGRTGVVVGHATSDGMLRVKVDGVRTPVYLTSDEIEVTS